MEINRNKEYHKVKKRKKAKTKKSTTPIIENTSRKNLKGRKKYQLQQEKKILMNEIFQNWKL